MKWFIILVLVFVILVSPILYYDFREFSDLKPKCDAAGGFLYKMAGHYRCVSVIKIER